MSLQRITKIVACPNCKSRYRWNEQQLGNTVGARQWTDGKLEGPAIIDLPELTICEHCGSFFWLKNAYVIKEEEVSDIENASEGSHYSIREVKGLNTDELVTAFEAGIVTSPDQEKYLRIRCWWSLSDPFRHGQLDRIESEYSDVFQVNLMALEGLLKEDDPVGQLMRAEIARELGEFATCIVRLALIPPEYEWASRQIRMLAQKENDNVAELQTIY